MTSSVVNPLIAAWTAWRWWKLQASGAGLEEAGPWGHLALWNYILSLVLSSLSPSQLP